MTTAYILAIGLFVSAAPPSVEAKSDRAARVADTYQPAPSSVRYEYNQRCVTMLDARGNVESRRCGL